jgi:carbonic anhydrase
MNISDVRSFFAVSFFLCLTLPSFAQAMGDEHATIPDEESTAWRYEGESGQANWASLSDAYTECQSGTRQSPVDIRGARFAHLPPLKFNYRTSMLSIHRKPNQLWLDYDSGSSLTIGGRRYRFLGFDFHTPGEHSFRSKVSDMEIHLHHLSANGEPLIVAIPVNGGHRMNITLTRIWENVPDTPTSRRRNRRAGINAMFLLPTDRSYYLYQGSETRPPCAEGVEWVVFKTPIRVSWEEIERFKALIGYNARSVQPLNNRPILMSAR